MAEVRSERVRVILDLVGHWATLAFTPSRWGTMGGFEQSNCDKTWGTYTWPLSLFPGTQLRRPLEPSE